MSDRHPASTAYLILGMLFATTGVVGIVNAFVPVSLAAAGIIFTSAFTLAGVIALFAALRRPGDEE
ncbi:hypothetical protein LX16_2441 [Stackebrandtia albiflava]|uniref:Uncharacterized protein n=1 Tax=Stackebrandtia albiflava TaxID=406432 RepID=A0A562V1G7_9ACTN|nr:hypothetical protein [Stackebrandtia albiflava]TWJ11714.1 hypothetical protein LX16_2441 [Stackebrandtia albiflava]